MCKEIDKLIIELARFSPMAHAVQTEFDKKNFVEFVKQFACDVVDDIKLRELLLLDK